MYFMSPSFSGWSPTRQTGRAEIDSPRRKVDSPLRVFPSGAPSGQVDVAPAAGDQQPRPDRSGSSPRRHEPDQKTIAHKWVVVGSFAGGHRRGSRLELRHKAHPVDRIPLFDMVAMPLMLSAFRRPWAVRAYVAPGRELPVEPVYAPIHQLLDAAAGRLEHARDRQGGSRPGVR